MTLDERIDKLIATPKGGKTLEDKYKEIVDEVGRGFTDVLAKAFGDAVNKLHAAKVKGDPDLDEILKIMTQGTSVSFSFPTPTHKSNVSHNGKNSTATGAAGTGVHMLGGAVTVGGSWNF